MSNYLLTEAVPTLTTLPNEILLMVLSSLGTVDRYNMGLVNSRFNKLVSTLKDWDLRVDVQCSKCFSETAKICENVGTVSIVEGSDCQFVARTRGV